MTLASFPSPTPSTESTTEPGRVQRPTPIKACIPWATQEGAATHSLCNRGTISLSYKGQTGRTCTFSGAVF